VCKVSPMQLAWLLTLVPQGALIAPVVSAGSGRPTSSVQSWGERNGVVCHGCEVGIAASGCRGLLATTCVQRSEPVLCVPRALTLSVDREDTNSMDPLDWLTRLSLRLAEEIDAGESSPHSEFVLSLPEPPRGPCQWDDDELGLLQNTTMAKAASSRAVLRLAEWSKVRTRLRAKAVSQVGSRNPTLGAQALSQRTFERAWHLTSSRVIGARGARNQRGEQLLLVPFIDMANHAAGTGGHLSFDRASGDVSLLAGTPLAPGDEVTLDYGARSTDEFLLQYGFVPSYNPHDESTIALACGTSAVVRWSDARDAAPEVRSACQELLDAYPTTLEGDVAELASAPPFTSLATALSYRIAKKSLLRAVAGHPAASAATSAFR